MYNWEVVDALFRENPLAGVEADSQIQGQSFGDGHTVLKINTKPSHLIFLDRASLFGSADVGIDAITVGFSRSGIGRASLVIVNPKGICSPPIPVAAGGFEFRADFNLV